MTKLVKESCPSTRVTALDLAPGMVSCMRELIKENHWEETVTAGEADIRDLSGVPSDSFSHAICNFGLASSVADLTGPARTVKEMWRVLDKGGVAVVSTWAGEYLYIIYLSIYQILFLHNVFYYLFWYSVLICSVTWLNILNKLERNWDAALEAVARKIRPHDEAYSWNIHADWTKGWFLMRLFEEAGFGYNVEVRNEPTYVEARDLDEMVENMMLFKDMFFKEYSEEEVAKIPALLKDELPKLKAFKQNEEGVKVEMMAWVGFASKE